MTTMNTNNHNTHDDKHQQSERVLSDKSIERLKCIESYITFFLIGAFLFMTVGNSIELFFDLSPGRIQTWLGTIGVDTIYVTVGGAIGILCNRFCSSR